MDIEIPNAIKLFFPNPSLVQVLYEALANSLDAGAKNISINIEIQSFSSPGSLKISVTDDGGGFTDERFDRFTRLLNPQDAFHKGLGRLVLVNDIYRNNAWLLDDKFMSFQTILSEAQMDSVIEAITLKEAPLKDVGRPDVTMIFSADPENSTAVDVVVVELKKITNEEKDNQFVINQLLTRARKLAAHCPNAQRIWYYAVIHINAEMEKSLLQQKFIPVFSKGKVYYNEFATRRPDGTTAPTPTFVMSFDAIVADAECRNHTFLEILRNGIKQQTEKMAAKDTAKSNDDCDPSAG